MGFLSNIFDSNNDLLFYVILGFLLFACSSKDFKLENLFEESSILIFIAVIFFLFFFKNNNNEREIE